MNQTVHAHQVIHAFARRDQGGCVSRGKNDARRRDTCNKKPAPLFGARTAVTTAIVLVPLMVSEFVLGEFASDGWLAGVLNQTAQLLALASPF